LIPTTPPEGTPVPVTPRQTDLLQIARTALTNDTPKDYAAAVSAITAGDV
jgi:hypothetical protein